MRNLYISKRRPWNPERSWRKIAGPRDVSRDDGADADQEREEDDEEDGGPGDVEDPLGPEHSLARQRRGEAVERQAEQLLDEGMGLGGAVQVDEDPRVHAEALARLEGVGEHLQALRGDGEEDLVDDQVTLQQLGQVAKAPDHRSVEHRGGRVRRVHAQAAAHDPARLRVAHESGDEAARAVSRAHHQGDARPALAPSRVAQPGEDEGALRPERDGAHAGEQEEHAAVDLLRLAEEEAGGEGEEPDDSHAENEPEPRARRPAHAVGAGDREQADPHRHDEAEEPEVVPERGGDAADRIVERRAEAIRHQERDEQRGDVGGEEPQDPLRPALAERHRAFSRSS